MEDGEVVIKVGVDDKDAEGQLRKLSRSISKLESDIEKKQNTRSGIAEQLRAANAEAETLAKKIKALEGLRDAKQRRESMSTRYGEAELAKQRSELKQLQAELARAQKLSTIRDDGTATTMAARQDSMRQIPALQQEIANKEQQIAAQEERRAAVLREIEETERRISLLSQRAGVPEYEVEDALKTAVQEAGRLEKTIASLSGKERAVTQEIERQTEEMQLQAETAGDLSRRVTQNANAGAVREALEGAKTSIIGTTKKLVLLGLGVRSLFALFRTLRTYIVDAVKAYAENDPETAANISELKSSLAQLKASWGAAFAPVLNYVTPVLQKLIGWLTTAAEAIAQFFAVLSGKTSYKKAVANTAAIADNVGSAAASAKAAQKYLSGLDELRTFDDNRDTGGGGGGGSSGSAGGGLTYEDVPLEAWTDSPFILAIKDVLPTFEWGKEVTKEYIAEKLIALLTTLPFATLGAMAGGLPGAIISGLLGFALGSYINSTVFNRDGKIDKEEISEGLVIGVLGLAGSVLGYLAGNNVGAIIGAALGISLGCYIDKTFFDKDGKLDVREKLIGVIAGVFGGALIGALLGPTGAVIGALVGLTIGLIFNFINGDTVKPDNWDGVHDALAEDATVNQDLLPKKSTSASGASVDYSLTVGVDKKSSASTIKKDMKTVRRDASRDGATDLDAAVNLKKGDWDSNAKDILEKGGETAASTVKANVKKGSEWNAEAALAAGLTNGTITRSVTAELTDLTYSNGWKTPQIASTASLGSHELSSEWETPEPTATAKFSTWKDNLKEKIVDGFSATFSTWKDNLKDKVSSFKADFSTWKDSLKNKIVSDFSATVSSWSDKIDAAKKWISGFGATVASWYNGLKKDKYGVYGWFSSFGATVANWYNGLKKDKYGVYGWFSSFGATVANWYNGLKKDKYGVYGWFSSFGATITNWYNGLKKDKHGVYGWLGSFGATITQWWNALTGRTVSFKAEGGALRGGHWTDFAAGGIITHGAMKRWGIPQYAGGTGKAHGTMFVAGEAGEEVVGHINGHTEVLNKSQLAQVMYAAILHGMASALNGFATRVTLQLGGIYGGVSRLASAAEAVASIPMPAVAQGYVVPHNAIGSCGADVGEVLSKLYDLLSGDGRGGYTYQFQAQINRRTLFDEFMTEADLRQKQSGMNPFAMT